MKARLMCVDRAKVKSDHEKVKHYVFDGHTVVTTSLGLAFELFLVRRR
jgi:hypothetical protein